VEVSTDPMSRTVTTTYNAVGQPLTVTVPNETITTTYGANGRTATVTDNRARPRLPMKRGTTGRRV